MKKSFNLNSRKTREERAVTHFFYTDSPTQRWTEWTFFFGLKNEADRASSQDFSFFNNNNNFTFLIIESPSEEHGLIFALWEKEQRLLKD